MAIHRVRHRRGFTLIELMVVIFIIILISSVALPVVLPAINHRQVDAAARILQGAIVGARDRAIHAGQPCGIRLLPDKSLFNYQGPTLPNGNPNPSVGQIDPTQPICYNRVIPIEAAPGYGEGMVTPIPVSAYQSLLTGAPSVPLSLSYSIAWPHHTNAMPLALLVVESPFGTRGEPNSPTSWFWNVRVGDKVQLGGAGPWYTVVGPMVQGPAQGNVDLFVNSPFKDASGNPIVPLVNGQMVEYLFLVNGRDDNNNGWIDEGWDGVDNNNSGATDEFAEWEAEQWQGSLASQSVTNVPYLARRRPIPSPNAGEIALPTDMVIDATTIFGSQERSRFPLDYATRLSGTIDILINPDGTVLPVTSYGVPSSFSMGSTFYHFFLAERQDIAGLNPHTTAPPYLPVAEPPGSGIVNAPAGPYLKGEYAMLSLNSRTGQLVVNASPSFYQNGTYNLNFPFLPAEQGVQAP